MEINTVKTCTCHFYIGDNPPCPVHGDPYANASARFVPPRMLKVDDERAIQKAALNHFVKAEINPDLSKGQP